MTTQNNGASGVNFMPMGVYLYKASSKMSKYQLELANLARQQEVNYAKSYAGFDADGKLNENQGVVAMYMNAATEGADAAGKSIKMDAKNALMGAVIGGVLLGASAASYMSTSTKEIDTNLENAKKVQAQLPESDLVLSDENALDEAKQAIYNKHLKNLEEVGGEHVDGYYKAVPKDADADKVAQITQENAEKKEALRHAQGDQRSKVEKNVKERIDELNQQKRDLNQKFSGIMQFMYTMQGPVTKAAETKNTYDKARYQAKSQIQQAVTQIESSIQQQQEKFIQTQEQDAEGYQQAANQAADVYGQITQTRG